jgi:hypothetical protein
MIARCREAGLPAPEFRQTGGQFVQTLRRPLPVPTPEATPEVTTEVTGQVAGQVLGYCQTPRSGKGIQALIGIRHRETFPENYLDPKRRGRPHGTFAQGHAGAG